MTPNFHARIAINPNAEETAGLIIPPGEELVGSGAFAASLEWRENSLALLVKETDGSPFTMSLCWEFEGWADL